jgi:hypothetical protein
VGDVGRVVAGHGVAAGHLGGVDEQPVGSAFDVGQQPVVDVARFDVAAEAHLGARRQEVGESRRCLRAEALVRPVGRHRLGRVDADEAHRLVPAVDGDDHGVTVDDAHDGRGTRHRRVDRG